MKNIINCQILCVIIFILFHGTAWGADLPASASYPTIFGAETNGYRAKVMVYGLWQSELVIIVQRPAGTNMLFAKTNFFDGPNYLMATNLLPGPFELKNDKGELVPTLKPALLSSNAYPDKLSWKALIFGMGNGWSGPVPGNDNLFKRKINDYSEEDELGIYNLHHLYRIEKPGDYSLTIFPKLYKEVQANGDVYQRIDLPPVTIPIHWDGAHWKWNFTN